MRSDLALWPSLTTFRFFARRNVFGWQRQISAACSNVSNFSIISLASYIKSERKAAGQSNENYENFCHCQHTAKAASVG